MSARKKIDPRIIRKERIRKKLSGTTARPRLAIFRSSQYIYAQLIDDSISKTVAAASSSEKEAKTKLKSRSNMEAAKWVGKTIGDRAKAKKVTTVVFDVSGYQYHGKVKAIAEGARESGLKF